MKELFTGVYEKDDRIYTNNAVPGKRVYDERLTHENGEYREWSFNRSKAAAAMKKGLQNFPLEEGSEILYLGASTGTTPSHFSDIAWDGIIYGVEYSPKIIRNLVGLSKQRKNIAPILGDARKPQEYAKLCSKVDVVYQDVAQKDQIRILKKNADMFLKEGGHAMIAIKAQSISSSKPVDEIFDESKEQLKEDFEILDGCKLAPFHTDHLFLTLKLK